MGGSKIKQDTMVVNTVGSYIRINSNQGECFVTTRLKNCRANYGVIEPFADLSSH